MSSGKSFSDHHIKSSNAEIINSVLDHLETVVSKLEKQLNAQREEMYNLSTLACELMENKVNSYERLTHHKVKEIENCIKENCKEERCSKSAVIVAPSYEELIVDEVEHLSSVEILRINNDMQDKVHECVSVLSSLMEHNSECFDGNNTREWEEISTEWGEHVSKPTKSQTLRQPIRSPRRLTEKERTVALFPVKNREKDEHQQECELSKVSNTRRSSLQYGERTLPFLSSSSCETTTLSELSETAWEHLPTHQERRLSFLNYHHAKQTRNSNSIIKCSLEENDSMNSSTPSLNASTISRVSEYNSANYDELQPIDNINKDNKLHKTSVSIINNSTLLSCGLSSYNGNSTANHTTIMTDSSTTCKSIDFQNKTNNKVYEHDALSFLIDTFSKQCTR